MKVPWVSISSTAFLALIAASLFAMEDQPASVSAPRVRATIVSREPVAYTPSLSSNALIVPVTGVARASLADTWGQARAAGRTHQGIDILAPQGTPVVAAVDGRIVKFFDSVRGGITIYEFDQNERWVYYYAHLEARAPGLAEGQTVRQGDVIGSVGMTGNAPVPHLHFEIERLGPGRQWWRAEALNPYPFLVAGRTPD